MLTSIGKRLLKILGIQYILDWLSRIKIFPSGVLLVLANLIPIFGVISLNWNAYDIILLYWIENIVIGICTVPRILLAHKPSIPKFSYISKKENQQFTLTSFFLNIFFSGFFLFHFGTFTSIHGIFVFNLIAKNSTFIINNDFSGLRIFFLALLISHGYSLIANYILKEEYRYRSAQEAMMKPYPRVTVIHLTIIFGAIISQFFPTLLIILFVAIKIFADLGLHLKSHYNSTPKYTLDT